MANLAPPKPTARDLTLDIAKGLAIMLVIAGHTLQGASPDFDDSLAFRAIYSFHMPFFIFLSGAVAAVRPPAAAAAGLTMRARVILTLYAIGRAALRLVIPFVVWTIISWYMNRRDTYSLSEWLLAVAKSVDMSLWFLLLVFYCQLLWQLWHCAMGTLCDCLRRWNAKQAAFILEQGVVSLGLLAFIGERILTLSFVTSAYGIGFVKQLFCFFVLGALYYVYGRPRLRGVARLIPYAVWAALIPFWYRIHPGPISEWLAPYIYPGISDRTFHVIVACAGIMAALDFVRLIDDMKIQPIDRFMAYCGVASLGIYAIHFYLLGYPPVFITPLLGSLAAYAILSRVPVVRLFLLGETGKRPAKIVLPSSGQTDKFDA